MTELLSTLAYTLKMEQQQAQDERPLTRKVHIVVTTLIIMAGMGVLDGYLVEQNYGSRKTGVFVMLLIGDVCLLLVLRYVALWVGTEVRTMKRGCSMIEWFLFIFVLDIKMYFILESVRKDCSALGFIVNSAPLVSAPSKSSLEAQIPGGGEEVRVEVVTPSIQPQNIVYSDCEYSLSAKKMLTLFQAIFIGGLYLLLVGADHLQSIASFRELEEVKMRAFWVVVDLLDILELQSSMWEAEQGQLPYLVEGFVYFYCYIVLIILPPLSLAELCKEEEEVRPHKMLIYLIGSLCVVNIGSSAIRLVLLLRHNFAATSTIFIGKNVICLGMKVTKLIQMKLIHANRLSFAPPAPPDCQQYAVGFVANGNAIACRESAAREEEDRKSLCARHESESQYQYGTWKDGESGTGDGSAHECPGGCDHKSRCAMSECSTLGHIAAVEVVSTDEPPGGPKCQMSYEDDRLRRVKFNGQQTRCVPSTTSGSDAGSSSGCARHVRSTGPNPRAPKSLENIFSEARASPRPPPLFSNVSSASLGRNRHSCALSYGDSYCETPVSEAACSCPHASRSTGDMTSLAAAASPLADFPAPVDVCFDNCQHQQQPPVSKPGALPAGRGRPVECKIIGGETLSDSELSDLAPPPPSMTLLQQSVLANGGVKRAPPPRLNLSDSDAESTSV